VTIEIDATQRDVLYEELLVRLDRLGSLQEAIEAEDYETADRLALEVSDDLRFIAEDLEWGRGPGGSIVLSTPADVLRRVSSRLREDAAALHRSEEADWAEARENEERNRLVAAACQAMLAGLGG
jgi:hypothetical protein